MKRLAYKTETWVYSTEKEANKDKELKRRDWKVSDERKWIGEIHVTYIHRY